MENTEDMRTMADGEGSLDCTKAPMRNVKAFLIANGVSITEADTCRTLRIKAKRRKTRIELNKGSVPTTAVAAMSLGQFKAKLNQCQEAGYCPKTFVCFNAKFCFVDPTVTVKRHSDNCRGIMKSGACSKTGCDYVGEGQDDFLMNITTQDLEDPKELLVIPAYKAAAGKIFGEDKTAKDIAKMNKEKLGDILEEWSEVAVCVHAIIDFNIATGKMRISPFNFIKLPDDYLIEY